MFSKTAAAAFIITKIGFATMVANTSNIAFLATAWGAALITVAGIGMLSNLAGMIGVVIGSVIISIMVSRLDDATLDNITLDNFEVTLKTLPSRTLNLIGEVDLILNGSIIGLGLATIVTPWIAVTAGFASIIVERFLPRYPMLNFFASTAAAFYPLAPLSLTTFVARNVGLAAAMIPSSVTAWLTPTPTLLFTGTGALAPTAAVITNPDSSCFGLASLYRSSHQ